MSHDSTNSGDTPDKGDEYLHEDGSKEIVYHVEDGRILSFREYPDHDAFEGATERATYTGRNEEVATLPGPESFAEVPADGNGGSGGDDSTSV